MPEQAKLKVFGKRETRSLGLDLAGSENRPTGFCMLEGMRAEASTVRAGDEILARISKVKPEVVAVDAPLSLPEGRKSIEQRTSVHLRECDRELQRRGIKFFPVTLGPMRTLTARGMRLKKALEGQFQVIEVYPGGAQDVLGIPRKQKGFENLRKGLERLGIEGLNCGMNDHELFARQLAFHRNVLQVGEAGLEPAISIL